jgi:hypothetical protein
MELFKALLRKKQHCSQKRRDPQGQTGGVRMELEGPSRVTGGSWEPEDKMGE